ncbi:hypothetical protein GQ53DRAFT_780186 [Thozetella sp. PMI_491]|nr:hypothetical protein GQ53DRAFT_780186 [Thozetella sp. PMI_491]
MSSPAQGGPSVPKEEKEKKGFGKVLSRMKTVLRRGDASKKRQSTLPTSGAVASTSTAPPPAPAEDPRAKALEKLSADATKVPRAQLYEERAKKLSERFGLEIKASEWYSSEGHALRVEKPIRMRVHRKCHQCDALFGLAKECPKCQHPRCKQCPRIPPKRSEAEKEESRKRRAAMLKERAENPPIIPDWDHSEKKVQLKKPSKTGGPDLVYKKARQRIRRTCCSCQRQFANIQSKTCEGCEHVRCTDCPRDPAKKDKYPYGYPGDEFGKNSVPHYKCPSCTTVFSSHTAHETGCTNCQHKPDAWERLKPRKVEPEPDPEAWKSLQAKLAELDLK